MSTKIYYVSTRWTKFACLNREEAMRLFTSLTTANELDVEQIPEDDGHISYTRKKAILKAPDGITLGCEAFEVVVPVSPADPF